ncbi:MAG: hypothetical protein IKP66_02000 [Lachnospiraceae bacterium]|nr:hypothetical protein [Lachnospiraceae bacterium]
MKKNINNIIILMMVFAVLAINISYAEQIVDKKGRIVEEIKKPTAESTIDPDTITAVDRRVVDMSLDYSGDTSKQYEGPSKNIFSSGYMYSGTEANFIDEKEYTLIRHTSSITDLTFEKYFLDQDDLKDRIRLKIVTSDGMIEGKNGFFKIDGKIYYFDENGLMVLGPCFDTIGNYFFFSYDTGELLEEIQKK